MQITMIQNTERNKLTTIDKLIRLIEIITCFFIIAGVIRHWN